MVDFDRDDAPDWADVCPRWAEPSPRPEPPRMSLRHVIEDEQHEWMMHKLRASLKAGKVRRRGAADAGLSSTKGRQRVASCASEQHGGRPQGEKAGAPTLPGGEP